MTELDDDDLESFDLKDNRRNAGDRSAPNVIDDLDDDEEEEEDGDDLDEDADELLDDAEAEDIDFVVAAYREDGASVVNALSDDLANDLEELIVQLRRLPADAGALGFVSLVEEIFVIVRVRGQHVQVLLNDAAAATEWPIARDVAEFLGVEVVEDEDEGEPLGDLGILSDLSVSDFDLSQAIDDPDLGSDQLLIEIAERIKIGPQFRRVVEAGYR